jgi:inward rectifier potassium channel
MRRPSSTRTVVPGADYSVRVIGQRPTPVRDFYHAMVRLPWWVTIAGIIVSFLVANALFALAYLGTGGLVHARPGSFVDAFFFSVQTMGTIGYGQLYPASVAANVLVVAESITGLLLAALYTGLVFAKFSRSTARLAFTDKAVISLMDGTPTLMLRLGNERGNQIVDARIRAVMVRTEKTAEGGTFYRMVDLPLQRERALSLSRSWSVLHPIGPNSPLYGETPESLAAKDVELQVLVIGLDDITMQTIHGAHRYFARQIVWGARHADILSEGDDGDLVLDLRKFQDVEPTRPTADFPYPRDARG